MEFRVIGININTQSPQINNASNVDSLGYSKEFLENEFKSSFKKINRNLSLQLQDIINLYARLGWEHYFQGQIGNLITLYFKRTKTLDELKIDNKLSPEEKAMLQSLDDDQLP